MLALSQLVRGSSLSQLDETDFDDDSYVKFDIRENGTTWKYNYRRKRWENDIFPNKLPFDGFYEGSIFYGTRFRDISIAKTIPSEEHVCDADEFVKRNLSKILHDNYDNYKTLKRIKNRVIQEAESREERYKINALHKMIDSDEMAEIPLGLESAGTLKMFALYPELQEVLEKGSVFFIDELNARLHPLLVRNFLLTFLNPEINNNHAQLVFTTHDTWQLSNQLLRRDEIWFVEKDERGVSTLYSLADFVDEDGSRIRKDESYEKNYLIGKYGAIPTLKSIDIFKEE